MPSTTPAPKTQVKSFLKAIAEFQKRWKIPSNRKLATVLGVREVTLASWLKKKRVPSLETVARVATDLAAIERFLASKPFPDCSPTQPCSRR